jgi:hypothetical protein
MRHCEYVKQTKGNWTMALTNFKAIEAQEIAANLEGYLEHGCETRAEYLAMLADEYCISLRTVKALASMLGPNEDFDGLVCACEDAMGEDEF